MDESRRKEILGRWACGGERAGSAGIGEALERELEGAPFRGRRVRLRAQAPDLGLAQAA